MFECRRTIILNGASHAAHTLTTVEQLEAHYGQPAGAAVWKEIDHINPQYRAFIEAAPFFVLASVGPEGVDARRAAMRRASCA